jgi:predicted transcriptional regulator
MSFVDKDTHRQSKKIIYSVYIFLKQLTEKSDLTADFFKNAQVITIQACGTSHCTVKRICAEARKSDDPETPDASPTFISPRKGYKRAKMVSELDDFDSDIVRRTVYEFYDRGEYTEDKERPGQPKKIEDKELEKLLDEDPCQTQDKLAESLGVDHSIISRRLHVMGMISKQGNWVPYELKPRYVEIRFSMCEQLLQRQNRKGFLHRIVTGVEKWIRHDNPKRKKSWVRPGTPSTPIPKPNIHGSKLMFCIWWDQQGVVYYELLKPNETITGERYRLQLMRLSRALKDKRPEFKQRHDKIIL